MQAALKYKAPGYTEVANQEVWTLKEKVVYSLLGIIVIGGALYMGRKLVLKRLANKEENSSLNDGAPATVAKQIKMAFENDGWPGTDTVALRNALRQISSKQEFTKVRQSYEKLYNTNLLKDMSSELQSTEYNEMIQILAAKPDKKGKAISAAAYTAWARRMKAAFDKTYGPFPGTDGEAIVAVINELPTQRDFVLMTTEYKRLYSTNLLDDLKSESEFGQYEEWMKIITAKPR